MPIDISQQQLTEIVERAQEGSPDDFYRLYEIFSKPIFNFIRRLIGSGVEAEDLTQETFLKVHSELGKLREPSQFKYWLYRIARNEVYQKLRRSKRTPEVSIDDEETEYYNFLPDESDGRDPERQVLSLEMQEIIDRTLAGLTPKYRDVFVLAVFHKMSYDDITKVVGRSLLSVKTDIYRARLAMKEALNEYLKRKTT
ncbi:MAG TPA: sigma-70 family RNA polymerase sigma factor [Acidobacteriota bacterium]|nr:sigma-70 family RNA polymerase sigma factor [Acidobacteriota bacterium]